MKTASAQSIWSLVREAPFDNEDAIVAWVLKHLSDDEIREQAQIRIAEVVRAERRRDGRQKVRDAQRHLERERAGRREDAHHSMFSVVSDAVHKSDFFRAAQAAMQFTSALINSTFRLPDGTEVVWGEATLLQHQLCREMLTKQVVGINDRIQLHDEAIRILAETSARCINVLRGGGLA